MSTHTPSLIPSQEIVLWKCVAAGKDDDALRTFFWLLNAPDPLYGLARIAENACRMIDIAAAFTTTEEQREEMRSWVSILNWLKRSFPDAPARVSSSNGNRSPSAAKPINPNLGRVAKRNAMWSLLWEIHPVPSCRKQFRLLVAHVFLAHAGILRLQVARKDWFSGILPYDEFCFDLYEGILPVKHFLTSDQSATSVLKGLPLRIPQSKIPQSLTAIAEKLRKGQPLAVAVDARSAKGTNSTLSRNRSHREAIRQDVIAIRWIIAWGLAPGEHSRKFIEGRQSPKPEPGDPGKGEPVPETPSQDEYPEKEQWPARSFVPDGLLV